LNPGPYSNYFPGNLKIVISQDTNYNFVSTYQFEIVNYNLLRRADYDTDHYLLFATIRETVIKEGNEVKFGGR
jgi:hypothetical protein